MTAHDDWDALIAATHEPLSPEEQARVDRIVAAVRARAERTHVVEDAANAWLYDNPFPVADCWGLWESEYRLRGIK